MNFREYLKSNIVLLDGGMGTLLQEKGLKPGELPELKNITDPQTVTEIHKSYFDAGSNVICTNTFGANLFKFESIQLNTVIKAAVQNAKSARNQSVSSSEKFIALDIGPLGKLLKPLGELDFEDAVNIFAATVKAGVSCGVDLIMIETMNDSYETKAAVLAAKENSSLPIIVSNAYGEDKKLMTGACADAMVALLEGLGVDAVGANCSLGPNQLMPVVESLLENASVPVAFKPNAGLPKIENGKTVFDISPEAFALELSNAVKKGVRLIGGCCGTTPEYIRACKKELRELSVKSITAKNITAVSSYTHCVKLGVFPVLIGERINPTGKKRLKQALIENDISYLLSEAVSQQEKGVHILDVNVGIPDIDETEVLKNTVCELQAVSDLPLQIDTSDPKAMEAALRLYNGKAMINSVNGKQESMHTIFPIAKKYGGVIVALTLDENGIPETSEGRFQIAEKILSVAKNYGIDKKNIIFDTLAMTVSADNKAAAVAVEALKAIKERLGCHTSLGVSNVSFGLPGRDKVNSIFFTVALENGLSAAIMNPNSAEMLNTYYTYLMLKGKDESCAGYINFSTASSPDKDSFEKPKAATTQSDLTLGYAIGKGLKDEAARLTRQMLDTMTALDIVNSEIIPALNSVGKAFEEKKLYLPQLLMSAEAAKSAFDTIKSSLKSTAAPKVKPTVELATVKGDIHDIGKNIVKLLLENYGYNVIDLGKDVAPEVIADTAERLSAPIVGLSALMTTTVPAMEDALKLIRNQVPQCKVVVGGAVITEEYAAKIGADKYAKDAMETVRYAETITKDTKL